jgi:hypothetical protein
MAGLDAYAGLTIVQALELARLQRDKRVSPGALSLRVGQIRERIERLPESEERATLSKRCAELAATLAVG